MGKLEKFESELLKQQGKYSKGYYYIPEDERVRVLLLKPKNSEKHSYYIPDFEGIKTTEVAKAVYALIKENNRRVIHITTVTGKTDIYMDDTLSDIFKKLTKLDEELLQSK